MAARKCTDLVKRKGAVKPRFIFVLPCRFMFWWWGLLSLVSSGFGFGTGPFTLPIAQPKNIYLTIISFAALIASLIWTATKV